MTILLLDVGAPADCQPVTCTRPLAACPVANRPLAAVQTERLQRAGFAVCDSSAAVPEAVVRLDAWLSSSDLDRMAHLRPPWRLVTSEGMALAWSGGGPREPEGAERVVSGPESFAIRSRIRRSRGFMPSSRAI